ncbi:hypothetical protein GGX14DRAFT_576639 [Mycena pura]|uniref:Uncharacterized protein n=1 Tax=Mycena pura TaxID=153505 RepID=A0AAD6UUX5_9AGAR|nr:hypothetical protein GGX14DRAFT_576639 [Mycena pura]
MDARGDGLTAQESADFQEQFQSLFQAKTMLTMSNVKDMIEQLPSLIEEITSLKRWDGWACTTKNCRFLAKTRKEMSSHLTMCSKSSTNESGNFETCTVQSLYPTSKHYFIRVYPVLNNITPGSGFLEFLSSVEDDPTFKAQLKPELVVEGDPRLYLDSFHAKTRWPVRVQEYSVPDLLSLVRVPKRRSGGQPSKLVAASKSWIASLEV